jgi:hypothetical protein
MSYKSTPIVNTTIYYIVNYIGMYTTNKFLIHYTYYVHQNYLVLKKLHVHWQVYCEHCHIAVNASVCMLWVSRIVTRK